MMLKILPVSLAIALSPSLLFTPLVASANTPDSAKSVLAKINGTSLTLEDFNARYAENSRFFQFSAPDRKSVLEDIIKRELVVQEARRLGLEKNPAVAERINTVLYQAALDRQLGKDVEKITVTDAEAKSYYAGNPEIRTSHIFAALPPGASPEMEKAARSRLEEALKELKKGGSFAEIAQQRSEGPTAPMGGDVDYKTRDALDPTYYAAALKLQKPGRITDIVRTPFGLHIIKLTAIRPWDETDHGQVKRQIFEQKRARIFESYVAGLRKKAKVSVNASLLKE